MGGYPSVISQPPRRKASDSCGKSCARLGLKMDIRIALKKGINFIKNMP